MCQPADTRSDGSQPCSVRSFFHAPANSSPSPARASVLDSVPSLDCVRCAGVLSLSMSALSYSDLSRFAGIFFTCNKDRDPTMPRRKTQQPEPRERFEVDGVDIEVRHEDMWLIDRKLHKQKT